jgi:tight adherence protein B
VDAVAAVRIRGRSLITDWLAPALAGGSGLAVAQAWRMRSSAAVARLVAAKGTPSDDRSRRWGARTASWRPSALVARALGAGLALGAGFVAAGPVGALSAAGVAVIAPAVVARRRAARRRAELDDQLADAVASMAAGLRAGLSLSQAIGFAGDEGRPPLSTALRAIVDRTSLGMRLTDALDEWCAADGGADVRLVRSVLRLHRRSGGDLPAVLDRLAATLRDRRSAAREVRSLTAQARLSGAILGLLPLAFFAFLALTSRRDLDAALATSTGRSAIIVGLAMQAAAFAWIRRLLRVG